MNTKKKERFVEKYFEDYRKKAHKEWLDEVINDIQPMPKLMKLIIIIVLAAIIIKIIFFP